MDTKKMNPFILGGPRSEFRRGNGLFSWIQFGMDDWSNFLKPLLTHLQMILLAYLSQPPLHDARQFLAAATRAYAQPLLVSLQSHLKSMCWWNHKRIPIDRYHWRFIAAGEAKD
jgi:hypothetical protein